MRGSPGTGSTIIVTYHTFLLFPLSAGTLYHEGRRRLELGPCRAGRAGPQRGPGMSGYGIFGVPRMVLASVIVLTCLTGGGKGCASMFPEGMPSARRDTPFVLLPV